MEPSQLHDSIEIEIGFTVGNLRLEPDGTLWNGQQTIHMAPKELAAFRVLLANPNRIVSPAQLKEILWPDVHVTPDSIPRCISSLRSHLGPEVHIRTIYKRGYRLESPVHRHAPSQSDTLPRLAIVPFATGMLVPEHLGAALAEEAATCFPAFQPAAVHVLASDSVFTIAAKGLAAGEIGKKVGADLILAGTLQSSPLFLRLRAEMTRVSDGAQIWVEEILAPRDNLALLRCRLLDRLAYRLGGEVPVSIEAVAGVAATDESNPSAYQAFLEARFESRTREPHRMHNAMELLRKAADLDHGNLAVRDQIGRLSTAMCLCGYTSPTDAAEQIRRTAEAGPEMDQPSAAILPALGWVLFHVEHQLPLAVRLLKGDSPKSSDSWSTRLRVMLALSRRRFADARQLLDQALRDDPCAPPFHALLAWMHHLAGNAHESVEQAHRCLTLFPGDERAELCAALIFAFNHDPDRGAVLAHEALQRRPTLDIAAAIEAYALARMNRRTEALAILQRLQWLGRERYVLRAFTAAAYVELGDIDGAIAELRAAEQARCPWFFQTLADPRLRPLHGNPHFDRMRNLLAAMETSLIPEPVG